MKLEIRKGSKGNPMMVVVFTEDSNYDVEKNEWVPKISEVMLISETLKKLVGKKELKL